MFCINCGAELEEGVKFCPNCGQQVGNNVQTQQPQAVYVVTKPKEPKSQFVAIILCLFLGLLGVHDFYLNRNKQAIAKLLITVFLGWIYVGLIINVIWCLSDLIIILMRNYDALLTDEELDRLHKGEREYEALKAKRKEMEKENSTW